MTSKKLIENFLTQKNIAIVGASRNSKKFGYSIYKEMKSKGYNVYPVNPGAQLIDGDKCYPNLLSLPINVEAAILIIPPSAAKEVVKDAYATGIKMIWMQQGSESESAINYCKEKGIEVIHNECVLMFTEPAAFFHKAHKWIWGVLGKLPN